MAEHMSKKEKYILAGYQYLIDHFSEEEVFEKIKAGCDCSDEEIRNTLNKYCRNCGISALF